MATATAPAPAPTPSVSYEFPKIFPGQSVRVVSDHNQWGHPFMGLISRARRQSAEIMVFTQNGPWLIPDCRHRYDPRVVDRPQWLTEDNRTRALFEPNDIDLQNQRTADDIQTLFGILDQQAKQIGAIQEALELLTNERAAKPDGRKTPSRKPSEG